MNDLRRTVISIAICLLMANLVYGQEAGITGKVMDENGRGLKGVEVEVKLKSLTTETGKKGSFSLSGVELGDSLSFTYLNYKVEEIEYSGEEGLEVSLSPIDLDDWMDLSLEDIMNIEIVSASKKAETVFESPLSSSVITREEIERSGATSIPECLRLAPGVIVREQTNGVYDVHLRGFDYIPPKTTYTQTINNITLVMIDNRIVYNYLDGGTFWQSLPIDLNDVERIEIIRGPSTALYGPNAAAGVINIITRTVDKEGLYAVANAQLGTMNTFIGNASVGYKQSAFSAIVSGNYQTRNRYQESYYIMSEGEYQPLPDSVFALSIGSYLSDLDHRYPDPKKAFDKYGINGFIQYNPSDKLDLRFSAGYQDAQSHQVYFDIGSIPFCVQDFNSYYLDLTADVYNFNIKASRVGGEQLTLGSDQTVPYSNSNFDLEYNWVLGNLSLRPGISYKKAEYDWISIGGKQDVKTYAGSIRADYTFEKFRLIGALRVDKYNTPDDYYPAYQVAGTYQINTNNLLRLVYSRANRAAFLADSYFDMNFSIPGSPIDVSLQGNEELKLVNMDMFELGYRANIREKLQVDLEIFYSQTQNYDLLLPYDTVYGAGSITLVEKYQNIKIKARQMGASFALNYYQSEKLQLKLSGTFQQTNLKDYAPLAENQDVTEDKKHEHTPSFYGGLGVNYRPMRRLNINAGAYFFTSFVFDHEDYSIPFPPPAVTYTNRDEVPTRFNLNMKVSYNLMENLSVFVNARNVLNLQSREFGFTDDIKGLYLAGISFSY